MTDEIRMEFRVGDVEVSCTVGESSAALGFAERWWGEMTGLLSGPYRPMVALADDPTEQSYQRRHRTARWVADYWRVSLLAATGIPEAAHALCMVLAALDGETDPTQLGIESERHADFRDEVEP